MKNLLIALIISIPFLSNAQGWVWARGSVCSSHGASEMEAIACYKPSGAIYVGGCNMADSLCLPPFTIHNAHDTQQFFIIKYDTSGNILWYRTNTSGQGAVQNLTTDASGNLYVFGVFSTPSISFGSHIIYNPKYYGGTLIFRNNCYFISKYDASGNLKWIKAGVNESVVGAQTVRCGNITTDAIGNSYICTHFIDSVIHIGPYTFTNTNYTDSMYSPCDLLLAKYDSSGNLVWAKAFGNSGEEKSIGLAVGTNDRVYVTGWYTSPTLTFGTTTLTHTGTLTDWRGRLFPDVFLAQFDTSGNTIWAKTSTGNARGNAIVLDGYNNAFLGGETYDTIFVAFGTDTLRNPLLAYGSFLTKYDDAGNCIWAKGFYPLNLGSGGWVSNMLFGLTTDPCNNVWAAGFMNQDPAGIFLDSAVVLHSPSGTVDPMFLVGYSPTGSLLQSLALKSGGDDGPGMSSDCHGNIYIASDSWSNMLIGSDSLHFYGAENMFLAKYNPNLGCSAFCGGMTEFLNSPVQDKSISLYPNPVSTQLTITSPDRINSVVIINPLGQTLINQIYDTSEVQVNVANLPTGIYLIKVNGSEIRKFLKQ